MKKFKKMDPILSDVLIKIINRYEEGRKKYGGETRPRATNFSYKI